jgi:hypothetical protein
MTFLVSDFYRKEHGAENFQVVRSFKKLASGFKAAAGFHL